MNANPSPTGRGPHPDGETLSAHADGELDDALGTTVAGHLGQCRDCRLRLQGLQGAISAIRAPVPPLPDARREEMLALASGMVRPRSAPGISRSWWVGMSAAAAVVVLAVASLFAVSRGGHRTPVAALEARRSRPGAGPFSAETAGGATAGPGSTGVPAPGAQGPAGAPLASPVGPPGPGSVTSSTARAAQATQGAGTAGSGAPGAAGAASAAPAAPAASSGPAPDLGAADDLDALAQAARRRIAGGGGGGVLACEASAQSSAGSDAGGSVLDATARYRGRPVQVFAFAPRGAFTYRVVVLAASDCSFTGSRDVAR